MAIEVGSILDGVVSKITDFGAFIQLDDKNSGLCHVSELSYSYVKKVSDFLVLQQDVKVKVIKLDSNGKISLSIRQTLEKPVKDKRTFSERPSRDRKNFIKKEFERPSKDFEGMLSSFIKTSGENQSSNKRNKSRKGNGYNQR